MITHLFNDKEFAEIAHKILNKSVLNVKKEDTVVQYRICEIEFYLNEQDHPDLYAHNTSDQLLFSVFTFHRYHTGTYRSGTWKGLDLAFGDKDSNRYCGILIRSILNLETGEFTEGPCLSVNKILSVFGYTTVKEFMGNREPLPLYNNNTNKELWLSYDDCNLSQEKLYCGKRVGLSNKYPNYRDLPYRFTVFPHKIRKQKSWQQEHNIII